MDNNFYNEKEQVIYLAVSANTLSGLGLEVGSECIIEVQREQK